MRHILSATQFGKEDCLQVFGTGDQIRELASQGQGRKRLKEVLAGKTIAILMLEASTRTRSSFEIAAKMLGADTLVFSSAAEMKITVGESLENTILSTAALIEGGIDAIVLRHKDDDASQRAAETLYRYHPEYRTIIICAGRGKDEHVTQGLLDVYTLYRHKKEALLSGKLVGGICGDLWGARYIHSLVPLLLEFGVKLYFIAPKGNNLPYWNRALLELKGQPYRKKTSLLKTAPKLRDFINLCRMQMERWRGKFDEEKLKALEKKYAQEYGLTNEVRAKLPETCLLMHPGPQKDEFPIFVKTDSHSVVEEQITNGTYLRAALLKRALNPEFPLNITKIIE